MRTNYFIYKGKRYEYGTIVKLQYRDITEAIFIVCDPEEDYYMFAFKNENCKDGYYNCRYTKRDLQDQMIEITDKIDTNYIECNPLQSVREINTLTFKEELSIDGIFIAWIWYIVLMAITLIFNEFYLYWIVISVCFFAYRSKKIKEEGYKQ